MKMWSSGGRRVLQELLSQPAVRSFSLSPAQNTVVVERWWQVPLSKVGSPPRLHPRRHRIYKLVEDTTHAPKEKMELILTQTVPKVGGRGDTVFVKKAVGRNKLLAEGLAVYPSLENKQMFSEELRLLREGKSEERIQTRTGQLTVELLKRTKLKINKMPSDEFQLTKEVVRRQFQKKLLIVVPPHALSLPFESVKDVGDYWCEVTVNGMDVVRIPISLMPYEDPSASYQRQLKTQMQEQQAAAEISDAAAVETVSEAAVEQAAVEAVSEAAVEEATVKAVSEAAVEEATVKAVSEAAVEEATVKAVSEAAVEEATVKAVSEAAVEEATVKAVSEAAVEEATVKAVSEAAVEEATVKAVSEAAVEEATVKAVSEAAVEEATVKAVSEAAVEAASDAAVEAEAGKDSVSEVSEAAASAGVSAAKEESAASTQTSPDTTAPPSDSPKKD